jgi:hypothetical protein
LIYVNETAAGRRILTEGALLCFYGNGA